jgi:hypothetical protein
MRFFSLSDSGHDGTAEDRRHELTIGGLRDDQ